MVIAFANQKGGVGKTTLCMLFANYLVTKGIDTLVIDVDRQRSLVAQRKSDISAFEEQEIMYNVEGADCDQRKSSQSMMDTAKNIPAIVLIDTPGNVTEDGLIPIFSQADAIICPYQYEDKCLESTGVFIQVLEELKKSYKEMNPKIFYVANMVDGRVGTAAERESWNAADEIFKQFGNVLPRVPLKAAIRRSNTLVLSKEQALEINKVFDVVVQKLNLEI